MPIKVFIADDSDIMRKAMRSALEETKEIEIVGESASFIEVMQVIGDCQTDVLLLDLQLPEKRQYEPSLVRRQLTGVCTLATSLSIDDTAKHLAKSYGAVSLLDKMTLYTNMVPEIRHCQRTEIRC